MKRTILIAVKAIACLVILLSVTLPHLPGTWTGKLMTADNTVYPLTYNFTLFGDSVAGTAKSKLGEFPIQEGKLDSSGLHFKVTVNGRDIPHNGIVYADSIGMNIILNGSRVHYTLSRAAN